MGTESLYLKGGGGKAAGALLRPPTSIYNIVQEWVDTNVIPSLCFQDMLYGEI